ncbi:hypothetical protein HDU76_012932 [Blyttiomyces sp. JEL0837]|nr:hypothetical protein HDU76_012932 [Blyttiomyces sp. JEL0837]
MEEFLPTAADLRAIPALPSSPEGNADEENDLGGEVHGNPETTNNQPHGNENKSQSSWSAIPTFSWGTILNTVKKQASGSAMGIKHYEEMMDLSEFISVVATESTSSAEKLTSTIHGLGVDEYLGGDEGNIDNDQNISAIKDNNEADQPESAEEFSSSAPTPTNRETFGSQLAQIHVEDIPEKVSHQVSKAVANLEALADKAENFLEKMGNGLGSFLSNVVTISAPGTNPVISRKIVYDRKSAAIAAIRLDMETYLKDPALFIDSKVPSERDMAERFQEFQLQFDISKVSAKIARIVDDDKDFEKLLSRLVPSQVSHEQFWQRYFFKVAEIDREEETRKRLMNDATLESEDFKWESDDEDQTSDSKITPEHLEPIANDLTEPNSPSKSKDVKGTDSESTEESFEVITDQNASESGLVAKLKLENTQDKPELEASGEKEAGDWEEWE